MSTEERASTARETDRQVLLRLALDNYTVRTEHRYRHKVTGFTCEQLDLRVTDLDEWYGEWRTVIETEWQ